MISIIDAIHLCIVLFILSIPLWPTEYIRIGIYLPLAISLSWILFDGCIFRLLTDKDKFVGRMLGIFGIEIDDKDAYRLGTAGLLLVTLLSGMRLDRGI